MNTCRPCDSLATGLPSLSQVRPGGGTPLASHRSRAASFTTTVTAPPGLETTGGAAGSRGASDTERRSEYQGAHLPVLTVHLQAVCELSSSGQVGRHTPVHAGVRQVSSLDLQPPAAVQHRHAAAAGALQRAAIFVPAFCPPPPAVRKRSAGGSDPLLLFFTRPWLVSTGRPSFSQVTLGVGKPLETHSRTTGRRRTTERSAGPLERMDGGTAAVGRRPLLLQSTHHSALLCVTVDDHVEGLLVVSGLVAGHASETSRVGNLSAGNHQPPPAAGDPHAAGLSDRLATFIPPGREQLLDEISRDGGSRRPRGDALELQRTVDHHRAVRHGVSAIDERRN
ncbi:hypothetical protein EYF80_062600 [Liparis tanakae]|uniref:Uncharacterized protein n=1 Tax=Liparis tanakae TaxID=230148 RepID=A0A4Z2EEF5_9TELE|nr:hypothetical protein EYF80_062600 [Liparis tanakae]